MWISSDSPLSVSVIFQFYQFSSVLLLYLMKEYPSSVLNSAVYFVPYSLGSVFRNYIFSLLLYHYIFHQCFLLLPKKNCSFLLLWKISSCNFTTSSNMHLSCFPIHCQISWKHHLIFLPNLICSSSQLPQISILPVCRNASVKVIIMASKISYLINYFLLPISLWHLAIGIPPYLFSKKTKVKFSDRSPTSLPAASSCSHLFPSCYMLFPCRSYS